MIYGRYQEVRIRKATWFGALMSALMALTLIGVAPAAAQDATVAADTCRGGGPSYWLANPWPKPFAVPKLFRQPNGKVAVVRKWTKFDSVFRYRGGRNSEGKIFPGKTLNQVLKLKGTQKKSLARHTIAALLNAGETKNDFATSKFWVIKDFQVYWDGTDDMNKRQARQYMAARMIQRNLGACPKT